MTNISSLLARRSIALECSFLSGIAVQRSFASLGPNWAISRYWFSPIAFQCQQTSLVSRPLGHHVDALVSGKS